ncbi:MAG: DegT/DnrJ/EryC1/StrS family aminotransferase, partial [Candidatus Omnitrophica bacterium]|nr:DegT/DnrJ/EryC1/StrS family aminotransferase [Candidatus Omnitrophota bacterium]
IREFEALSAEYFGSMFAVSANSATSALVMALGAFNLEPGDEVIVPCMSFNATATAILFFNCIPVFAEVKSTTYCIDPQDIRRKISPRTKAIIVVHLGGSTADMDAIMAIAKEHKLKVLEDCAQAPGVKYKGKYVGTIGDAGVFSLTETKNITCGEGGILVTDDRHIALKTRLIRNHGEGVVKDSWPDEMLANIIGMNFRLTELQAAVAVEQFKSLDDRNRGRVENTKYLINQLKKYPQLIPPQTEPDSDYICFMLKWRYQPSAGMPTRDQLAKKLNEEGIPVIKGYGRMMHENPMFTKKIAYGTNHFPFIEPWFDGKRIKYGTGACLLSEKMNQEFIWFKYVNHPNSRSDMDDVIKAFEKVLG